MHNSKTSATGIRSKCKRCDRPLRGHNDKIAEHPGTVRHKARGLCDMCYKKMPLPIERTVSSFSAEERAVASAVGRLVPQSEWREVMGMLGLSSHLVLGPQSSGSEPVVWRQGIVR